MEQQERCAVLFWLFRLKATHFRENNEEYPAHTTKNAVLYKSENVKMHDLESYELQPVFE